MAALLTTAPAGRAIFPDDAGTQLPLLCATPVGDADVVVLASANIDGRLGLEQSTSVQCAWPLGTFPEVQRRANELPPAQRWMTSLAPGRCRSCALLAESAIEAWKLRTAGCSALVLPLDELCEAAAEEDDGGWDHVAMQLARMRRAVSAVDYPPTIFHIGEDELVTRPEVE